MARNVLPLIGTRNFTSQTVEANEIINLGSVYRRFCQRIDNTPTFSFNGNDVRYVS